MAVEARALLVVVWAAAVGGAMAMGCGEVDPGTDGGTQGDGDGDAYPECKEPDEGFSAYMLSFSEGLPPSSDDFHYSYYTGDCVIASFEERSDAETSSEILDVHMTCVTIEELTEGSAEFAEAITLTISRAMDSPAPSMGALPLDSTLLVEYAPWDYDDDPENMTPDRGRVKWGEQVMAVWGSGSATELTPPPVVGRWGDEPWYPFEAQGEYGVCPLDSWGCGGKERFGFRFESGHLLLDQTEEVVNAEGRGYVMNLQASIVNDCNEYWGGYHLHAYLI